jgi:hypothetical protein
LAFACFYLVYTRIEQAAARDSLTVIQYLTVFFREADWVMWLAIMVPYSVFFFIIDAHATWRVVKWFNAPTLKLTDVLPIRASAYILSLVNEQVGKGAMSIYLLRRHEVPGWQALSSMIFLGIVEIYQLLFFSAVGVFLYAELVREASSALPLDAILPAVFLVALAYFPLHQAYFSGRIFKGSKIRDVPILVAFRKARVVDYLLVVLFKAPFSRLSGGWCVQHGDAHVFRKLQCGDWRAVSAEGKQGAIRRRAVGGRGLSRGPASIRCWLRPASRLSS